jgi:hypothetical protein
MSRVFQKNSVSVISRPTQAQLNHDSISLLSRRFKIKLEASRQAGFRPPPRLREAIPVDQKRLNREQDQDGEQRASNDDEGYPRLPVHLAPSEGPDPSSSTK